MKLKYNGQRVFRNGQRIRTIYQQEEEPMTIKLPQLLRMLKEYEEEKRKAALPDGDRSPPCLMTKRPIEKEIDDWYESHSEKLKVHVGDGEEVTVETLSESPPCIMAPVMEQK